MVNRLTYFNQFTSGVGGGGGGGGAIFGFGLDPNNGQQLGQTGLEESVAIYGMVAPDPGPPAEPWATIPLPAGTIRNLRVHVEGNTINNVCTVTIMKDGVDTALTLNIPALTDGDFTELVTGIAFAAGERVTFHNDSFGPGVGEFIEFLSGSVQFIPS